MTKPAIRALLTLIGGIATVALTACAVPPMAPVTLAAATTDAADVESETMTGSRIPRKTTDRLLRHTDAAGAKEMERSRAPNPGLSFN